MTAVLFAGLALVVPNAQAPGDPDAVGSVSFTARSERGTGVIAFRDGKRSAHGSAAVPRGWVPGPVAVRAVRKGGGYLHEAEAAAPAPGEGWSAELTTLPNGTYHVWAVHTVYLLQDGAVAGHQLVGSALAEVRVAGSPAADRVAGGAIGLAGEPERIGDRTEFRAAGMLTVERGWWADADGIAVEAIPAAGGAVRSARITLGDDGSGWAGCRNGVNSRPAYNLLAVARLAPDLRNRPREPFPHRVAGTWALDR